MAMGNAQKIAVRSACDSMEAKVPLPLTVLVACRGLDANP